jgi:hypothetical protein
MRAAGVLVLTVEPWSYAAGVVPGKTYEYLASGRPTLALVPADGDAAAVLRDARGGTVCAPGDADAIAAVLREHAAAWTARAPLGGAPAEGLASYARPAQATAVAEIVRAAVARR